jgi:hypothetical protein
LHNGFIMSGKYLRDGLKVLGLWVYVSLIAIAVIGTYPLIGVALMFLGGLAVGLMAVKPYLAAAGVLQQDAGAVADRGTSGQGEPDAAQVLPPQMSQTMKPPTAEAQPAVKP